MQPHATALGAALLASVGRRTHADIPTAVKAMVRLETLEADPELTSSGETDFARWSQLYPEFHKLAL